MLRSKLSAQNLCAPVDFYPWLDGQKPPQAVPLEEQLPLPVTPYVATLPIAPTVRPDGSGRLKMVMVPAMAQLHPELTNPTKVWVYRAEESSLDGLQTPIGPTIEVNQGQTAFVEWKNELFGPDGQWAKHPVFAVTNLPAYVSFPNLTPPEAHASKNLPGRTLGEHDHSAAKLPPWTVVHLHGGRSESNSDGWPENAIYPGQVQRDTYTNNQPGTLLWYHDHAMSFTRLNVYAGLAGFYLIRDPLEKTLNLPCGSHDHELLLLLQDRALTCADDHVNQDADQLLHKTGTAGQDTIKSRPDVGQSPMEFFGPLTLVNGAIWPRHTVKKDVYRLRILNGCSARVYRLRFTDDKGKLVQVPMQMIGSDGGLLSKPINLPKKGALTLAPAERVDVLVDFSGVSGSVELRNFAKAPFDGSDANARNPQADFLPYKQVMRFDVEGESANHCFLNPHQTLLASATPWTPAAAKSAASVERLVALVEDDTGVLQLMECAPLKDKNEVHRVWDGSSDLPATQLALKQRGDNQHLLYCLLPSMFSDPVRFLARDGDVEIWKIINISPDTHPVHIHLIQFKLLSRESYSETARVPDLGGYETHILKAPPKKLDAVETGWKDTIRVNPMELTTIAVPFRDYAPGDIAPESGKNIGMTGRYVYHCHIFEHEDHEMMRPYVVMPAPVVEHMMHKNAHMNHMGVAPASSDAAPAVPSAGWYMEPNLCCCDAHAPNEQHTPPSREVPPTD